MTFAEAEEALKNGVKVYHNGEMQPATGIGFLVARGTPEEKRPLGGDIDCCRNLVQLIRETGYLSDAKLSDQARYDL